MRPRRDVADADAFPSGFCGCWPTFAAGGAGSHFSLGDGATVLSQTQLEGLTRLDLARLHRRPTPDYFRRIGFQISGISVQTTMEPAITTETLGATVHSVNDAPVISIPAAYSGSPAYTVAPGVTVTIAGLGFMWMGWT